ncbi:HD domain-containing protein [Mucilaginibacter sp. cycad4]|uniref:HD domain-containing protein n=1 Tax=Mucilaginibacter sp. cycad4 TaxID=3342096 RepID=UPI002AAC3647|nr:HD domain-containing protein [Mucilaginibacter gossypii]WPU99183.1 HD domain-containing protein [Mucilaginibacter gossypii]
MFSDIIVPDSAIARQAEEFARSVSSDMLFNHVMRCYYFGELLAQQENSKVDRELMFLSSVLHDLGFTDAGRGENRFEIEGAHAARKFLLDHGVADDRAWKIWDNIALHTTDISLYKDEGSRILQFGILYDLVALPPEIKIDPRDVAEVVHRYPRLGFKQSFYELFHDELDRKQPYPHKFHFCSCIEHHRSGTLTQIIPEPQSLLNGAPFSE